jgi:E3 ubiquitin-protein ligase UBR7
VIQLYTKRNFTCDCGNSKFKNECKLFEAKTPTNRKNQYNHNYKDEYCTCGKAYPPAEDDPMYGAEMIQCLMCEDWFHCEHIGLEGVKTEELAEMACPGCAEKFPFLFAYERASVNEVSSFIY